MQCVLSQLVGIYAVNNTTIANITITSLWFQSLEFQSKRTIPLN